MYGWNEEWMDASMHRWMDTSMHAQMHASTDPEQGFCFKTNVSEAFDVTIAKIVVSASLNK